MSITFVRSYGPQLVFCGALKGDVNILRPSFLHCKVRCAVVLNFHSRNLSRIFTTNIYFEQ